MEENGSSFLRACRFKKKIRLEEKQFLRPCESKRFIKNDWTALPEDILRLISDFLDLPDLFRFGCVCKPWQSVCPPTLFHNHMPWLLHPINPTNTSLAFDHENLGFFSLCDTKIYNAWLPQLSNRRICASFPGGWLMTVHENSEIQLFNPFVLKTPIHHLPSLTQFPSVIAKTEEGYVGIKYFGGTSNEKFYLRPKEMRDNFISKVAMSSPIVTNGTVIMAIQGIGSSLAFYTFGGTQNEWNLATPSQKHFHFNDVTYYKGNFYAIHDNGYVIVIKNLHGTTGSGGLPYGQQVVPRHPGKLSEHYYILESAGDLLVVFRNFVHLGELDSNDWRIVPPIRTVGFKVFRIELGFPESNWVEITTLGDRCIFLGYNSSFSLNASDFSGCKPNHIYFTDDSGGYFVNQVHGGHDLGVFSLEDNNVETFLYPSDTLLLKPPPLWFAPFPLIS